MKIVLCVRNDDKREDAKARTMLAALAANLCSGCKIMDFGEFMAAWSRSDSDDFDPQDCDSQEIEATDTIVVPMCTQEDVKALMAYIGMRLGVQPNPPPLTVVEIGEEGEERLVLFEEVLVDDEYPTTDEPQDGDEEEHY